MTFMSSDGMYEFDCLEDCQWYEESYVYFDKKYGYSILDMEKRIIIFKEDKRQEQYEAFIENEGRFTEYLYICIMNKQSFRELEALINNWEDRMKEPFPYGYFQKDPKYATDEEVENFINNMLVYDKNTKQWIKTNLTLEEGMNKYDLNTEYISYKEDFKNIDLEELKNYIK